MTNQEKKAYLKRYRQINEEINRKMEELEMWHARATKITTSYSDLPKGTGEDKIQLAVDKIWEIDNQINEDIDLLYDMKKKIEKAINTVPNQTLQRLLRYRYIDGHKFEQIAIEMNYSWRQIIRLHGDALDKMSLYVI